MAQTVNVMIGKIQSGAVSGGCEVRHLYNCNDLGQATQGQRASIHTGRFIKRPHSVTSLPYTQTHTNTILFPGAHRIGLSPVGFTQLPKF